MFEFDLCGVLLTATSALGDAIADHAVVVLTGAVGLPLATAEVSFLCGSQPRHSLFDRLAIFLSIIQLTAPP